MVGGGVFGEAGVLSLHFAGGGPALCLWRRREGEAADLHADDGEIFRVPGGCVLHDEQSHPLASGGAIDAGGRVI